MNREVEKLLPRALKAVNEYLLNDKGIVFKEYDGYAANLGAAIRMSGLLPALSFFTDVHKMKNNKTKPWRNRLLVAVLYVLGKDIPKGHPANGRKLLELVVADQSDDEKQRDWKKNITEASVALKLALRTFVHTEKEVNQD